MPLVTHPRIGKKLRRVAALAVVACFAGTGVAEAAACPTQATSTPFAAWGDTSNYFLASGGAFEGAKASWVISSSTTLSAGNEPWKVRGATDTQSLTLNGGSAKSPQFCVDSTMPHIRFFARQTVRGTGLRVSMILQGGSTVSGANNNKIVELADGSTPSWTATGQLPVSVPLQVPVGSSVQAALQFQTTTNTGSWQIDDVYVDPFRR